MAFPGERRQKPGTSEACRSLSVDSNGIRLFRVYYMRVTDFYIFKVSRAQHKASVIKN